MANFKYLKATMQIMGPNYSELFQRSQQETIALNYKEANDNLSMFRTVQQWNISQELDGPPFLEQ